MLDNVNYGPNGYAMHEESYAAENEYQNNYSSMQMMPPLYAKQHMSCSSGTHGAYPGGGWNVNPRYQNGWSSPDMPQNGWSSNTGYYHHASGGKYPGNVGPMMASGGKYPGNVGPMMAPGRIPPNHMMMNSEYETYQAVPGRMRLQKYGSEYESYDDFANAMHNGREKVEWKSL